MGCWKAIVGFECGQYAWCRWHSLQRCTVPISDVWTSFWQTIVFSGCIQYAWRRRHSLQRCNDHDSTETLFASSCIAVSYDRTLFLLRKLVKGRGRDLSGARSSIFPSICPGFHPLSGHQHAQNFHVLYTSTNRSTKKKSTPPLCPSKVAAR